jgi:predicted nucleic acid-binding protein
VNRVLFDINVILDVLLDRKPHAEASAAVWAAVETGATEGFLAAHAVTTIHYLLRKDVGGAKARRILSAILRVFQVGPVDRSVIEEALHLPLADFEDAVTSASARASGCECIVTRDPKGFRGSPVRSFTPEALIPLLNKPRS